MIQCSMMPCKTSDMMQRALVSATRIATCPKSKHSIQPLPLSWLIYSSTCFLMCTGLSVSRRI